MTYSRRVVSISVPFVLALALVAQAADVSKQHADSLAKKVAIINQHAARPAPRGPLRTPVSESEVNSWFVYRAQPILPKGVSDPTLVFIGNGRVTGTVTVDLETYGRQRSTGGVFDPWSLLGGRVPITVTGALQTSAGRGRFEMQEASVGGLPVPKTLLQELLSYYSRSDEYPQGVRIDDPFTLPAQIQQVEIGAGQAVVVQ